MDVLFTLNDIGHEVGIYLVGNGEQLGTQKMLQIHFLGAGLKNSKQMSKLWSSFVILVKADKNSLHKRGIDALRKST